MLRPLFVARAAFNLLFGVVLLWLAHQGHGGLAGGGLFALGDGLLALAIAVTLTRMGAGWLAVLAGLDGALRLVAGAVVVANPGLGQMPLTAALVLVLLAVALLTLGIVGLGYVLFALRGHPVLWPAAAICLCTLLLGAGLSLSFIDQQLRLLLAIYGLALGVVLALAAWRVGQAPAAVPG